MFTLKQLARSIQTKLASMPGRTPASPRAMPYTEFTFAALGRLAKASGVVRPVHIELAQQLMRDLGFGPNDRRRAILLFDYGKRPDCDFVPLSVACRKTLEDRDVLNEMALESLCVMAWSQGPPKPECRRELERLAALLEHSCAAAAVDRGAGRAAASATATPAAAAGLSGAGCGSLDRRRRTETCVSATDEPASPGQTRRRDRRA